MDFKPVAQTSYDEVKRLHRDSDVDENPLAQHHTLGILPNQASPGDHTHDGRTSRKIRGFDLDVRDLPYQPMGGTLGDQPVFSSDPMIYGSYAHLGAVCHFQIEVYFDNITDFGTGQYYLTVPFASEHEIFVTSGVLKDVTSGKFYAISGLIGAGSDQMLLYSVASNGNVIPFTDGTPIVLDTAGSFIVSGIYHIQA